MTEAEIKQLIIDIFKKVSPDKNYDKTNDEISLKEQYGFDSMDFLDIIMEVRKRYKLDIPSQDYPKLVTMKSWVEYLSEKIDKAQ